MRKVQDVARITFAVVSLCAVYQFGTYVSNAKHFFSGHGLYNNLVILIGGICIMSSIGVCLVMSYVIPIIECEMKLTLSEQGIVTSMAFTGMIFSSHLFGYLADRYGRRYVIVRCNYASALLSVLASFCPDVISLSIVWFLNGFITAGVLTPSYVYVSEFCTFEYRALALLVAAAVGALATTYMPVLASIVLPMEFNINISEWFHYSSWRLFVLLVALPSLIGNLLLYFFPESPKYTLNDGNNMETMCTLQSMFRWNNRKPKSQYTVKQVCLDKNDIQISEKESFLKSMWDQTNVLFSPPLIKYTLVSCSTQLGVLGMYNIVLLWLPKMINEMNRYAKEHAEYGATLCDVLANKQVSVNSSTENMDTTFYETMRNCKDIDTSVYSVNIIIGISQFIVFCFSGKLAQLMGKKSLIVTFLALSAVFCFFITIVKTIILTLSMFGIIVVLVAAALPIALSVIVDFFPTNVRSMATCICMVCGRLGSSVGGQVLGFMQESYCELSYYGLSIILLGVATLCFISPIKRS